MALPRKGSRTVVIDGVNYRWRVRHRPSFTQGIAENNLLLAVETAEEPGSKLVIVLPQAHPNNWMGGEAAAVLPSDVEHYIRAALKAGWKPKSPGGTFLLKAVPES